MSFRDSNQFYSATWNGSNRASVLNAATAADMFDKTLRSSPSFNSDPAPPSYFEAIGIQSHINYATSASTTNEIYLNINNQDHPHAPQRIIDREQPLSSNKDNNQLNYPRHQIIRTRNLSANCPYYNYSLESGNRAAASSSQKPSEAYLVWSIFTTVYCLFIGIIALIFSIKVRHYNKEGDFQKAYSASKIARNFNIAGLFFGVIYFAVVLLVCILPVAL